MGAPTSWWKYTGEYGPFVDGISSPLMQNLETGELLSSRALPVGALWAADAEPSVYPKGPDGLAVFCRLPGGTDWLIDGRASNCTMPEDKEHRCWVRHGTVGEKLTIDKNGHTCAAGAGSILVEGYHGFLRDGELT